MSAHKFRNRAIAREEKRAKALARVVPQLPRKQKEQMATRTSKHRGQSVPR